MTNDAKGTSKERQRNVKGTSKERQRNDLFMTAGFMFEKLLPDELFNDFEGTSKECQRNVKGTSKERQRNVEGTWRETFPSSFCL